MVTRTSLFDLWRLAPRVVLAGSALLSASVVGADWPRFRGPDGSGLSAEADVSLKVDVDANLRWKAACGKGTSSPIVAGGRVYLTSFDGDNRSIQCFDADNGGMLWEKSVVAKRKDVATEPGGPANSTPASDGEHVYAFFPDAGLYCWSRAGEQRWEIDLGPFQSFHGVAASLVLVEGRVIVLVDQLEDSFLAAYDAPTGDELWRIKRQDGPLGGYSTPATRRTAAGKLELIVSGPGEVAGYDPSSGSRNWSVAGASNAPISVPVASGNHVFVCEPAFSENPFKIDSLLEHDKDKDGELSFAELESPSQPQIVRAAKRIDQGWGNGDGKVSGDEMDSAFSSFMVGGGLVAIQLDESQSPAAATVAWKYRKDVPQIPSLFLENDALFMVNDGGILFSMNPATGDIVKRARLPQGGSFYASPVSSNGQILLLDTKGNVSIVDARPEWSVVATSQLGESCYATPAIAEGSIFIRGESSLFCFRDAP